MVEQDIAVAPFKRKLTIGTIDSGHGRRRAVVTIDVEYDAEGELHIVGDARRPGAADIDMGGQIQDTLRQLIEQGMEQGEVTIDYQATWDAAALTRLLDIWDSWHLNHMRASCEHQRALGWGELAQEPRTIYHWRLNHDVTRQVKAALKTAEEALRRGETAKLDDDMAALARFSYDATSTGPEPPAPVYDPAPLTAYSRPSEVKTLGWLRPSEHPEGLLTKPCPECGYRYGTEWRREPVPADVLRELQLLPRPNPTTEEERR